MMIAKGRLIIDPSKDPYRPRLPQAYNYVGFHAAYMLKVCVASTGDVESVNPLRSRAPVELTDEVVNRVKRWRYEPYSINGRPVPFCFMLRLDLRGGE
jgi:hypothetical protein